MSRIIQALNAMISNQQHLEDVQFLNAREIYFGYRTKYKLYIWSMRPEPEEDTYYAWYYPAFETVSEAVQAGGSMDHDYPMVTYSSAEIGTREAKTTFVELYTILREKVYGVDKVFDDIIDSW